MPRASGCPSPRWKKSSAGSYQWPLNGPMGPDYERPNVSDITPARWRWKPARPSASLPKGRWWRVFHDPGAGRARKRGCRRQPGSSTGHGVDEARAAAGESRSAFFPELALDPSVNRQRASGHLPTPIPVAEVRQARAAYRESLAQYRETVLGAFRDVEDSLAELAFLKRQAEAEEEALASARRVEALATHVMRPARPVTWAWLRPEGRARPGAAEGRNPGQAIRGRHSAYKGPGQRLERETGFYL